MKNGVEWADIPNPDWTIVGQKLDNGVALLASKHLTWAKLQRVAQDTIPLHAMTAGWMKTGVFLSLHMGVDDFVVVWAEDYAKAFAYLFGRWSPDTERLALPSTEEGQRELE